MGWETVAIAAAAAYAGSELAKSGAGGKIGSPAPTTGPSPTTVMAAQRAEKDHEAQLKKRRRATVMGGDYGTLNVQTEKLGT